jgi:four helix bundle protein
MNIASKEARETLYWIQLLKETELVNFNFDELKQKCEEIVRILTSIVKTSQLNIKHYVDKKFRAKSIVEPFC